MTKPEKKLSKTMTEEEIQKAIEELDFTAEEKGKKMLEGLLDQAQRSGVTPKKALQITDDMMETLYSQGYNQYNRGMYTEASYAFRMLIMLDFTEPKYIMGLAACLHMLEQYEQAASMYLVTAVMDKKNPLPFYHAADCYLKLGSPLSATFILEQAIDEAGDSPEYKILVERAQMMIETLKPEAEKERLQQEAEAKEAEAAKPKRPKSKKKKHKEA